MELYTKIREVLLAILAIPLLLPAQAPAFQVMETDTGKAAELTKQAEQYYSEAKWDSAVIAYDRARTIYESHSLTFKALECRKEIAKIYRWQEEYEKAVKECRELVRIAERNDWPGLIIQGEATHALVSMNKGNFQKGLDIMDAGIDSTMLAAAGPSDTGYYYSTLGQLYESTGERKHAISNYNRVLSLYEAHPDMEPKLISSVYNNIGIAYRMVGDYEKALASYKSRLEFSEENNYAINPVDLAITYNNMGGVYYKKGDYGKAINFYNKALNNLTAAPSKQWDTINMAYNNIGVCHYQLENYKKALTNLEKALDIKLKMMRDDHPKLATAYLNLGAIYAEVGQTAKALDRYKKARIIREKQLGENHPKMVNIFEAMGGFYFDLDKFTQAAKQYRKALDIQLSNYGKQHPQTAYLHNKIGKTLEEEDKFSEALSQYEQGLSVMLPSLSAEDTLNIEAIPGEIVNPLLLDIMENMGGILHTHYLITRNMAELKRSFQIYQTASAYLDRLQYKYEDETSKLHIAERSHDLHEGAIAASYDLYRATGDPKYKEQAFHFAEKSRYRLLAELTRDTHAKEYANIPDSLIEYEQSLKGRLTKYNHYIAQYNQPRAVTDSSKLSAYRDSIFTLNRRLQHHFNDLEERYPRYYKFKYDAHLLDIGTLQQEWIQQDQAILEYFLGSDNLYSFSLTSSSFEMRKVSVEDSLSDQIRKYRKSIRDKESAHWISAGNQLYEVLVQPNTDVLEKEKIIIIPDGELHYLPFETLLTQPVEIPDSQSPDYASMPYLIKDHAISYDLSTHFHVKHKNEIRTSPQNRENSLLAIAPTFNDSLTAGNASSSGSGYRLDLTSLPLARYEAQSIAELARNQDNIWNWFNPARVEVWTGEKATEKRIKNSDLSSYNHIHFATHAYVSEKNPEQTAIYLAQQSDTLNTTNDGILSTPELYNMDLNASLVVLSACQTGYGPFINGEGIMGLTRPIFYSGASNVMVSLWQVSDRPTAELMIEFYEHHYVGLSLAEALRRTKLKMIEQGKYSEPTYWSSFILMGS